MQCATYRIVVYGSSRSQLKTILCYLFFVVLSFELRRRRPSACAHIPFVRVFVCVVVWSAVLERARFTALLFLPISGRAESAGWSYEAAARCKQAVAAAATTETRQPRLSHACRHAVAIHRCPFCCQSRNEPRNRWHGNFVCFLQPVCYFVCVFFVCVVKRRVCARSRVWEWFGQPWSDAPKNK